MRKILEIGALSLGFVTVTMAAEDRIRSPADYAAAEKQLAETYSLSRVAQERIEVQWEDLKGMATPLAQRVPIQACHHPEVAYVHPDLSLSIGRDASAFGIGFAVGNPPQLPNMWKVTQRLQKDYLPIVESEWRVGSITLKQTAFAILPRDRNTITGKEIQYVVVRLSIGNTNVTACDTSLYVLIGDSAREGGYGPFLTPIGRWQTPDTSGIGMRESALIRNGHMLLTYRCSEPTAVDYAPRIEGVITAGHPDVLTNVLRFGIRLNAGEQRVIDLVVAGSSKLYEEDERVAMEKVDFDSALQRAVADWDARLTPAMEYVTPEPRLNNVYKQLILSCLQNILKNPDRPWHEPVQTPAYYFGVWPWEFAHMAVPLMAIGYHQELRSSLRYLTERQNGVGTYSANQMAEGDVKSMKGSFGGTVIAWMGDTGGALWALAAEYRYSRDAEWLKANQTNILAAWDWVQTARTQTRITDKDGKKVSYYGLLPSGRCDDEGGKTYGFTVTDNFTWFGMSEMAIAFQQAGLPEADRLAREAEEYRQCLLDVIRQNQSVHPETKQLIISNAVGSQIERMWHGNGPVHLFDTGLLRPQDERFEPMLEHTRRKYGILMGLTEHYAGGNQWYPNQTERSYYKCFLGRGEIEKSLLVFYSNLAYGRSSDTYQTVERILVNNPNTSPFEPNMSGNGRMLDMMRRMLIDEQDAAEGRLWLLRGCPCRWFGKGETIIARKARTLFGEMGVVMRSEGDTITTDVDSPTWESPKEIRLVLRHPERKTITKATINGKTAVVEGETIIVPSPTGRLQIICKY